jgi:hypothetical protein
MALINVHWNTDLKATNALLARLVNVLERIATKRLGIALEDEPEPDEKSKDGVSYTSDIVEIRKEVAEKTGIPLEEPEEEHV